MNKLIYIGVYLESRGFCLASPPNMFFISKLIIIDWSITLCDVTPKSRITRSLVFLIIICPFFLGYCQSILYIRLLITPQSILYIQLLITPQSILYIQLLIIPQSILYIQLLITPQSILYIQLLITPQSILYIQLLITPLVSSNFSIELTTLLIVKIFYFVAQPKVTKSR
jgi:preprotein translocase subunit Sec61beta